jgi:Histidine kinase-, DNA gyrase B-, and HSP90-like ATPase
MPEAVQLQMFQRSFSTRKGRGRGIGSYSVKLLIEKYLHGKVWFVSREPEGTTFFVALSPCLRLPRMFFPRLSFINCSSSCLPSIAWAYCFPGELPMPKWATGKRPSSGSHLRRHVLAQEWLIGATYRLISIWT